VGFLKSAGAHQTPTAALRSSSAPASCSNSVVRPITTPLIALPAAAVKRNLSVAARLVPPVREAGLSRRPGAGAQRQFDRLASGPGDVWSPPRHPLPWSCRSNPHDLLASASETVSCAPAGDGGAGGGPARVCSRCSSSATRRNNWGSCWIASTWRLVFRSGWAG
jgi:hypothetical protein